MIIFCAVTFLALMALCNVGGTLKENDKALPFETAERHWSNIPLEFQKECRFELCDLRERFCDEHLMTCTSCENACSPSSLNLFRDPSDRALEAEKCQQKCQVYYEHKQKTITIDKGPNITKTDTTNGGKGFMNTTKVEEGPAMNSSSVSGIKGQEVKDSGTITNHLVAIIIVSAAAAVVAILGLTYFGYRRKKRRTKKKLMRKASPETGCADNNELHELVTNKTSILPQNLDTSQLHSTPCDN